LDKDAIVRRSRDGQHSPQKKRILRTERERQNRRYTSAIKTYFRLEAAVQNGDGRPRSQAPRPDDTIDKAVKRGALHRNTGARRSAARPACADGRSS
jgi:small subunit ribosomal protein S20